MTTSSYLQECVLSWNMLSVFGADLLKIIQLKKQVGLCPERPDPMLQFFRFPPQRTKPPKPRCSRFLTDRSRLLMDPSRLQMARSFRLDTLPLPRARALGANALSWQPRWARAAAVSSVKPAWYFRKMCRKCMPWGKVSMTETLTRVKRSFGSFGPSDITRGVFVSASSSFRAEEKAHLDRGLCGKTWEFLFSVCCVGCDQLLQ